MMESSRISRARGAAVAEVSRAPRLRNTNQYSRIPGRELKPKEYAIVVYFYISLRISNANFVIILFQAIGTTPWTPDYSSF